MLPQNFIDETEQYTRKRWLVFSIICASHRLLIDSFHALYLGRESPPFSAVILIDSIPFLLLCRFAYYKSGTRWLTFAMVMTFLGLIELVEPSFIVQTNDLGFLGYSLITIDFFLSIGWLSLSFKLRKVNARARYFWKKVLQWQVLQPEG